MYNWQSRSKSASRPKVLGEQLFGLNASLYFPQLPRSSRIPCLFVSEPAFIVVVLNYVLYELLFVLACSVDWWTLFLLLFSSTHGISTACEKCTKGNHCELGRDNNMSEAVHHFHPVIDGTYNV